MFEQFESKKNTWLIATGLFLLILSILLGRVRGIFFDTLKGLMVGIALCCCIIYLVFEFLPEKYR